MILYPFGANNSSYLFQAILLHAVDKGASSDAQIPRCLRLVAFMPFECPTDDLAFDLVEIYRLGRERKPKLPVRWQRGFDRHWNVLERQSIAIGKYHHPLYQILKFPHVAHPGVIEEDLEHFASYVG